jgi:hypothetical protein
MNGKERGEAKWKEERIGEINRRKRNFIDLHSEIIMTKEFIIKQLIYI